MLTLDKAIDKFSDEYQAFNQVTGDKRMNFVEVTEKLTAALKAGEDNLMLCWLGELVLLTAETFMKSGRPSTGELLCDLHQTLQLAQAVVNLHEKLGAKHKLRNIPGFVTHCDKFISVMRGMKP